MTLLDLSPKEDEMPSPIDAKSKEEGTVSREALESYALNVGAYLLSDTTTEKLVTKYRREIPHLFFRGNASLLEKPTVSVVGTRTPTSLGISRTEKLTDGLVELGFVVLSGLAKGVDTAAHKAALRSGGMTIAVLGTPIHKIYPAENKALGEEISKSGLLLSASLPEEEHGRYLFPRRNRVMALLSRATIIVEAGPTSGVIHQAAECMRQGRTLIFLRSLAEDKSLPWVSGFLKSGAKVLSHQNELAELLK